MNNKIFINPKLLLCIYSSIIVGVLIVLLDNFFFNSNLRNSTTTDPQSYLWFSLFFTLPHIFASFFGFFEKEYIQAYGKKMLRGTQVIILATILLPLASIYLTFLLVALYTMSHIFLQQSGISKSLMRGANRSHKYWQWSGILMSFIMYTSIYSEYKIRSDVVVIGILLCLIPYTIFGYKASLASKTKIGSRYFWSTFATPIVSLLFLILGYPILTIAIPRVIHDITAFIFYLAHDHNRFIDKKENLIYKITSKLQIPIIIASPLLAIAVTALFRTDRSSQMFTMTFMFIILFHYYVEGFVWKGNTLHKNQISYGNRLVRNDPQAGV